MMKKKSTFLFYDYETFGTNPCKDKIAQFASIRTDKNFNIIEKPVVLYCKIPEYYIPNPDSILITGILPTYVNYHGLNESEFSKNIYNIMKKPNTCIVGYNNINFDDEFTRNIFYRNFIDPYEWSWRKNNSRWDILNLVIACYVLRPFKIKWFIKKNKQVSLKLAHLIKINNLNFNQPHDALNDVYSTISIAKLINNKQKKLFSFFFNYRKKRKLVELINIFYMTPLIHISTLYNKSKYMSIILPVIWHKYYTNSLIYFNLNENIKNFFEICEKYKNKKKLNFIEIIKKNKSLNILNVNKCPIFVPLKFFNVKKFLNFNINYKYCLKNLKLIKQKKNLKEIILNLFKIKINNYSSDVELQLYNNFFEEKDKKIIKKIRNMKNINEIQKINFNNYDNRIKKLLFKYKYINFYKDIKKTDKKIWQKYCKRKIKKKITIYYQKIDELMLKYKKNKKKKKILTQIKEYYIYLNNLTS
ncbi:exodeoxyribonuclease I [Buchnera aphidicola (Taiwanaphis decaspermi)]|uniref:exodeoxyribonuclease I n=1 Tax=Buchnera aphidicola TaxID=9 RepID=UPI0031B81C74